MRIHPYDENTARPHLLSSGRQRIDMVVDASGDDLAGKHFGCHSHAAAASHVSQGSDTNATQHTTQLDVTQVLVLITQDRPDVVVEVEGVN